MAYRLLAGQTIRVEIKTFVNRASARKTLERLFMQDKQGWRDAGASAELGQLVYNKSIHPVAAEILQQYKNKAIV